MAFKLDPPAAAGEYEKAKEYFMEQGMWEDVKDESIDGMVYFYRWRMEKKSWVDLLNEAEHPRGELWPPLEEGEVEKAEEYFRNEGLWEDIKHQEPEGIVYCYRWRHAHK